jgi:hypothetical protein
LTEAGIVVEQILDKQMHIFASRRGRGLHLLSPSIPTTAPPHDIAGRSHR